MRFWRNPLSFVCWTLALATQCACSAMPEQAAISAWQTQLITTAKTPSEVSPEALSAIDEERAAGDLRGARERAFSLLSSANDDAELLWRLARAEADEVFRLKAAGAERPTRDLAAASGLDFAQRARAATPTPSAALLGQLAWSLGTTTHLQPMFDRADHAQKTLDVIDETLALDPDELSALATLATLRLRLATLPWIAKVMAVGAPTGSVEEATRLARRCVELEPNIEHQLLLAKALVEADRQPEARAVLQDALSQPDRFARDQVSRAAAQTALDELVAD